jgi:putative ABC transport system permease protein
MIFIHLSNSITWPVEYLIMNNWLKDFAFRIDFPFWVFVVSVLITIVISILTDSYQAIKAALANPVESIKYE